MRCNDPEEKKKRKVVFCVDFCVNNQHGHHCDFNLDEYGNHISEQECDNIDG